MKLNKWEMNYDGRMTGEIQHDSKKRFEDGELVTTSKVIEITRSKEGVPVSILTTSGTVYELGEPYVKT